MIVDEDLQRMLWADSHSADSSPHEVSVAWLCPVSVVSGQCELVVYPLDSDE